MTVTIEPVPDDDTERLERLLADPKLRDLRDLVDSLQAHSEIMDARDDLIRDLRAQGYSVEDLAVVGGVKPARVYQIVPAVRPRKHREESPAEA